MVHNSESYVDELIKIGILNVEDLEINRVGLLSERQKRILYIELGFWLALASLEVVAFVALAYYHIFILGNWSLLIFEIPLFVILVYWCNGHIAPIWKDLKADKSTSITGRLTKHFSTTSGNTRGTTTGHCTIRVGDQVFSISPSVYDYIVDEESYRIYYVGNTRKVINIEPLLTFKESTTAKI